MTANEDRILDLEAQVAHLEMSQSTVLKMIDDAEALEEISPIQLKWLYWAIRSALEVRDQ